jgi:uncharacterized GH25 family protein
MRMNRRKKFVTVVVLLILSILAEAHEFWLQPDKFIYSVGETLKVSVASGSNFIGTPTTLSNAVVDKLELHTLTETLDLKASMQFGEKSGLSLPLVHEGTLVVALQTQNQFIETEANSFNAYLKDAGLDDVTYAREHSSTQTQSGKENYKQFTKLMIQVGTTTNNTFKKVMGWPIEIIPEKNPYSVKVGELLKFKILSHSKPLFGAKVQVWNRANNRTIIQPVYTMQDGTVEARISNKGTWMVTVVRMTPSKDKGADWQSYKSSFVFGVQ